MNQSSGPVARRGGIEHSRFLLLIVCLLGMLVILPALPREAHRAIGVDVALLAVLTSCIWSVGKRKPLIAAGFVLLLPAFAAAWLASDASHRLLAVAGLICSLAFLAMTAGVMLINIVKQREVGTDTVLGGISVYLLLAVMWALVFEIIERVHPGSFAPLSPEDTAIATGRLVSTDFIYYSIFTLTTIGPQDVHPVSSAARSWTGLEALVGQIYLAVLIARLVARHASRN